LFWKAKTWTLRRDLNMSKDMRDWPRANLGVAANMFKHMLVTGCTNSVWVWNVDKSWGAKNAMDPMLELPPGKVKESFAQQHECRGFVRVRWSMGWPTGIESHGDEIPSRNVHIFIHAVATGDVHESSPGFLDPIHPGYEGIYLWWHVEGEPTAMHWLVNFHDFQEEIGVVSWAQLCLCRASLSDPSSVGFWHPAMACCCSVSQQDMFRPFICHECEDKHMLPAARHPGRKILFSFGRVLFGQLFFPVPQ
jgi:hypothetical protein